MNKEKIDKIKKKIKRNAPTILVLGITTFVMVVVVKNLRDFSKKTLAGMNDDLLPVILGEERSTMLGREDTILQKIEDDLYFLSVKPN